MSQKQRGLFVVATLLIGAVLISSCTFSLSQAPEATPTLIPTGLFVSPFPSVENPMEMIEEFARQTSEAQTALASGGTPGTPSTAVTAVTGTVLTPQSGGTPTPTNPSTPTNVGATAVVVVPTFTPGGPTSTPVPPGSRPSTYTLVRGEFPYCIARRYNINQQELLQLNGLTNAQAQSLPVGYTLRIPQTGNPWVGDRSLDDHPDTYVVTGNDDLTIHGVACKYGDIEPSAIANANGLSLSATLTIGQSLTIP